MFLLNIIAKDNFSHSCPRDFLMSQWQQKDKCLLFLVYKWFIALFFVSCVAYSIIINVERGDFHCYFIYLTHLNLCTTMMTMLYGAFLVTTYHFNVWQVQKEMPQKLKIYWYLWNHSITLSFAVSISYWTMNYNDCEVIDLNNILIHITNSLVLVVDALIVKHPSKFFNFVLTLLFEVYYTLFTVIYQFLGGLDKQGENYVYPTADWKNHPEKAAAIFAIVIFGSTVVHIVINFIHEVRHQLGVYLENKKAAAKENKKLNILPV